MATAAIAITEQQHAYLETPTSTPTIKRSTGDKSLDNRLVGISHCRVLIEDVPALMKAMYRGASAAVKARRLPCILVGIRSLRRRPEDPNDNSRFVEDVTLASSLIDDAVSSAIEELYRQPEEFLAKSLDARKHDAHERGQRHAWRLLDALKRSKEVSMDPPSDDPDRNGDDCPLTSMVDDLALKLTEYDPVLGKTIYHSASRPGWQRANEYEDRLIDRIDRRRAGLTAFEEPRETAYERAMKVLGQDNADFMVGYEVLRDTGRDKPACSADRKRYSRLRTRLGHGISPDVAELTGSLSRESPKSREWGSYLTPVLGLGLTLGRDDEPQRSRTKKLLTRWHVSHSGAC
jgi:hypothetical protein